MKVECLAKKLNGHLVTLIQSTVFSVSEC